MKKYKLILPITLLTTASGFLPFTSCSSRHYEMSDLTKEIITEMIGSQEDEQILGTCAIPHPSHHCQQIAAYLQRRIHQILGEESVVHIDSYNNVWCDIKPNNPHNKNFDPIILQAHTDMVVAGMSEEESLTCGIKPEIKGKLMHAKGHKTSLGADNGIGIAAILKIMNQRSNFEHGLIRCIFTADEEVGLIGARNLSTDALKSNGNFIPYLLNLDEEKAGRICRSCLGVFRDRYYKNYPEQNATPPFTNAIDLRIDNLKGGHSGLDIVLGRANADRIIFEFINYLIQKGVEVEIGAYDHVKKVDGQDVDIKWQSNQLIENGRAIIYCNNCDESQVRTYLNQYLATLPSRYPGEDVNSWATSVAAAAWHESNPYISVTETTNLAKLIGGNLENSQDIGSQGFPYGVFDKSEEGKVNASGNIGPVVISDEEGTSKSLYLTIEIMYRTGLYGTETDPQPQDWSIGWSRPKYHQALIMCGMQDNVENIEIVQPWQSTPGVNDQMILFLDQTFAQMGIEHTIFDPQGTTEIAAWITKNPSLICASIGPTIDDAHTKKETLHLDTVDNYYNAILKTLAWVEKNN